MPAPHTAITCRFTFEAAHRLAWHPGRCRNLHGHSYTLEVTLAGPLDGRGVVADFDDVERAVRAAVVDEFDHTDLNTVVDNPTAELLAHEAWDRLERSGLPVAELRLWETPDCSVVLTAGTETRTGDA